jgi:hypothetical protein
MANMMPRDGTAWGSVEIERKFGLALAPCPFCGGQPLLFLSRIPHVTCGRCGADGPREHSDSRDGLTDRQYRACKAWNSRQKL